MIKIYTKEGSDEVAFSIGDIMFAMRLLFKNDEEFNVDGKISAKDSKGDYNMEFDIGALKPMKHDGLSEPPFSQSKGVLYMSVKKDSDLVERIVGKFFESGGKFEGYLAKRKGTAFYNGTLHPLGFSSHYESEKKTFHIIDTIDVFRLICEHRLTII